MNSNGPTSCAIHGESPNAWACPECLRELREGAVSLKDALDTAYDNCHAWEDAANHWKANHDNQVKINRMLRERPDLGNRAAFVDALLEEHRQALQEKQTRIDWLERQLLARDFPNFKA
jgi:hypothetical protein